MAEKGFAAPQRAYLIAKAAYDAANNAKNAQLDKELPPELFGTTKLGSLEQVALLNRYVERAEELAKIYDVPRFRKLLTGAEDCLLEWGHDRIKNLPGYGPEVKAIFNSCVHQRADLRQQVIDLTMRLNA